MREQLYGMYSYGPVLMRVECVYTLVPYKRSLVVVCCYVVLLKSAFFPLFSWRFLFSGYFSAVHFSPEQKGSVSVLLRTASSAVAETSHHLFCLLFSLSGAPW